DFLHQKSWIEKVVKAAGHFCIFSPKFHPELNDPVEMCWRWLKRQIQDFNDGKYTTLQHLVKE
ncbi:hypothetical protein M427DRAFT_87461, partial [Gonapodya prolifera JEL478]